MTTCPSGVNYMHLVDQARVRIEQDYSRPLPERLLARGAGLGAAAARTVSRQHDRWRGSAGRSRRLLPAPKPASATPTLLRRIKAMLALAPGRLPAPGPAGGSVFPAIGERRGRVALLQGCAQQVLAPRINQAAINLLTRHGIEVVLVKDEQCCGALTHHLGHDGDALARARANIDVWHKRGRTRRPRRHPGDDVGLRHGDQGLRLHAARGPRIRRRRPRRISALAKDITEYLAGIDLQPSQPARRHHRRLSLGLFAAARTENHAGSERIAFQEWIRGERCTREPFVLRFGGDLQHSPARHCEQIARSQGRQYRDGQAGHDCCGQYRVHGADCRRHVSSCGAHD